MCSLAFCEQFAKDFRLMRAMDQVALIFHFSRKFLNWTRLYRNMMQQSLHEGKSNGEQLGLLLIGRLGISVHIDYQICICWLFCFIIVMVHFQSN